jgi:hypothetical protein
MYGTAPTTSIRTSSRMSSSSTAEARVARAGTPWRPFCALAWPMKQTSTLPHVKCDNGTNPKCHHKNSSDAERTFMSHQHSRAAQVWSAGQHLPQ